MLLHYSQEKKANKKKKKGVLPSGGLKAKMKDDIADYGEFDGGYGNEYDDFMWQRFIFPFPFPLCPDAPGDIQHLPVLATQCHLERWTMCQPFTLFQWW